MEVHQNTEETQIYQTLTSPIHAQTPSISRRLTVPRYLGSYGQRIADRATENQVLPEDSSFELHENHVRTYVLRWLSTNNLQTARAF